jgi:hypothetical protein
VARSKLCVADRGHQRKGAETVAETVPEERRSSNEPEPPERGVAVVLWLFAVLIAEVEALLWLFEPMYAQ